MNKSLSKDDIEFGFNFSFVTIYVISYFMIIKYYNRISLHVCLSEEI